MTVTAWRIASETPDYNAHDMQGIGARTTGGRWNSKGTAVVYCASSIALATLETVHYFSGDGLPYNRYLVRIEIPPALWAARRVLDPPPAGWDAIPAGLTSRTAGDAWARARDTALLLVPSVIVPDEYNVLVNPRHDGAAAIGATTIRRWHYDPRLFS